MTDKPELSTDELLNYFDSGAPEPILAPPSPPPVAVPLDDSQNPDDLVSCGTCGGLLLRAAAVEGRYHITCAPSGNGPVSLPQVVVTPSSALTAKRSVLVPQIVEVAGLRERAAAAKAAVANARLAWEAKNKVLLDVAKQLAVELAEAERALREAAEVEYHIHGDKKIAPGVAVRIQTAVEYDAGAALAWCKQHDMFLTFDQAGFGRHAKEHPDQVPFVAVDEEVQVTLAQDLRRALEVEGVEL